MSGGDAPEDPGGRDGVARGRGGAVACPDFVIWNLWFEVDARQRLILVQDEHEDIVDSCECGSEIFHLSQSIRH